VTQPPEKSKDFGISGVYSKDVFRDIMDVA
jgi:hypothetical protein